MLRNPKTPTIFTYFWANYLERFAPILFPHLWKELTTPPTPLKASFWPSHPFVICDTCCFNPILLGGKKYPIVASFVYLASDFFKSDDKYYLRLEFGVYVRISCLFFNQIWWLLIIVHLKLQKLFFKTCFSVYNIQLNVCGREENSKWIL